MNHDELKLRAGVALPEVRFMLQEQRRAAARIIRDIDRIAKREGEIEGNDCEGYLLRQQHDRPRHVAFIDGARGIGKTTLLLKIESLVRCLGTGWYAMDRRSHNESVRSSGGDHQQERCGRENVQRGLGPCAETDLKRCVGGDRHAAGRCDYTELKALFCEKNHFNVEEHLGMEVDRLLTPVNIKGRERSVAFALPVIFPDDMEVYGNTMEAIFAKMIHALTERIQSPSVGEECHTNKMENILNSLKDEVAQGWYFSRQLGAEALLRDSSDFNDFIRRRTDEATKGYRRIATWRCWLNVFLNAMGCELLVISIDDTDISPALTHDILQSLLIYLDHPRIFTVLVGNLRSMQYSLLEHSLSRLRPAIETLGSKDGAIAVEWRNHVSHQVAEYILKVLPWSHRYDLTMTGCDDDIAFKAPPARPATGKKAGDDDPIKNCPGAYISSAPCCRCEQEPSERTLKDIDKQKKLEKIRSRYSKITSIGLGGYEPGTANTFDIFVDELLNRERVDFFWFKSQSHKKFLLQKSKQGGKTDLHADNYLALWLLKHGYEKLKLRNMRHIIDFKTAMESGDTAGNHTEKAGVVDHLHRRVAEALFYNPANTELSSLFRDDDKRFTHWLARQRISSQWRGSRHFRINEQTIPEHTYSFDYLMFHLDLGISYPVWESDEVMLDPRLLPKPDGFNTYPQDSLVLFSHKQFIAHLDERYGVANVLNHPIVPANCIYFRDLCDLPDIAWKNETDGSKDGKNTMGNFEARIKDEWHTFFSFTGSKSTPDHTKNVAGYMVRVIFKGLEKAFFIYDEPTGAMTRHSLLWWEHSNRIKRNDGNIDITLADRTPSLKVGDDVRIPKDNYYPVDKYYRGIVNDVRCAFHALRIYDRGNRDNKYIEYRRWRIDDRRYRSKTGCLRLRHPSGRAVSLAIFVADSLSLP